MKEIFDLALKIYNSEDSVRDEAIGVMVAMVIQLGADITGKTLIEMTAYAGARMNESSKLINSMMERPTLPITDELMMTLLPGIKE